MKKNRIEQIADGVYQIRYYWLGIADVSMYLIVGKDRALMIDSGYSTTHAKQYAETVTHLPIDLINTHGHFDHIGGNADFETVYLSRADWIVAREHSDYDSLKILLDRYKASSLAVRTLLGIPPIAKAADATLRITPCRYTELPAEGRLELGDRSVLFFETPGHTMGSICIFDEKSRILFPGDMLCQEGVLLGFDYSTSVAQYLDSIRRIQAFYRQNRGEKIFPAHQKTPVGLELFDRYIDVCEKILRGEVRGKYKDMGLCRGLSVTRNGLTILYRENE